MRREEIPALFAEIEGAVAAGQCAAGFFSYECGNCFEPKAGRARPEPGQPLAWVGIYARSYVFDRKTGKFVDGEPPELERFRAQIEGGPAAEGAGTGKPRRPIRGSPRNLRSAKPNTPSASPGFTSGFAPGTCTNSISPRRLRIEAQGSAAALYARLRARQPVDYGAFLHWQPGRHILSFSPELFFRVELR